jgi:polyadenylate-binding protein
MATATSSTPYASASLYVGDLARDVTEAMLFEIFNAVGPVASVRICRDAATRRSLGYAYVNFHRMEDAERALDTMNFKLIRGVTCRIMWSHRDPSLRKSGLGNIFVKNLKKSIDHKQLFDTFSIFGNILSCKVATNEKGESLGYGFVHYESEEAAQNAIQRVNGKVIAGKQVEVMQFVPKRDRGDPTKFTNLYIKNLPLELSEDKFKEMFSKYGKIQSAKLALDKDKKYRGFGFVDYETSDQAKAAIAALNDTKMGDKQLYVAPFQKKKDRERSLRAIWEQRKAERVSKYQGVNLYIKYLSDNIDDARLIQEFKKFGSIQSAKVMMDDHGKSKGFGFVCFSTPEEANKALIEMNGRMLEGKPLYVTLAQPKEVRRAQLEAQYQARSMGAFGGPPMYPGPQGALQFYQNNLHVKSFSPNPFMMVPGRWNPGAQGGPASHQMMGMPGPQNMSYSLMPVTSRQGGGGPQRGRGRGRGGAGGQVRQQQGGQPHPGASGAPFDQRGRVPDVQAPGGVRYTGNVRNPTIAPQQQSMASQQRGVPARAGPPPPKPAPAPAPVAAPAQAAVPASAQQQANLIIQQLAAAPESMKKQMIGERLFPLVQAQQPVLAGKITGMLLEMDNGELLLLLESREALNQKIAEALAVLEQAEKEEGDEEEDEEEDDA